MLLLAILVLVALVMQADPATVADHLRQANLTILLAVIALYLLNMLTKVVRWYVLLYRKGERLPFGKVALYFLIGMAINNSTPGRVTGEPVRAYLVKTGTGYPMGHGMASIFVEKTIDTIVTLTYAVVGLVLLAGVLNPKASEDLMLSSGIVALFMIGLIAFIVFPGIPRRLSAWFFGRLRRRGETERAERWEATMDGFLGTFEHGTREIARNPRTTMAATGLTAVIWFNEALRLWLVFVALGFDPGPSFELMMVATALASFAALLIPLGAGSSTAIAAICTLAGIDGSLSTTAGLVFVMTSIWISIPLGAAAMALSGIRAADVLERGSTEEA
ncbi:MAG: flippase-like domain-containing protein [Thermoplasmata archaeon]|nr:MAG: flippase-like domain-containing protein [Thermoplasmata archaeon]